MAVLVSTVAIDTESSASDANAAGAAEDRPGAIVMDDFEPRGDCGLAVAERRCGGLVRVQRWPATSRSDPERSERAVRRSSALEKGTSLPVRTA
jgi:hypothetical protein